MKSMSLTARAVLVALGIAAAASAEASTITAWDFTSAAPAGTNSPAATTGSGTAITLGMTNSYNGGNTASDDIVSTAGTANPSFSENTWRIRGAQTPTGHNGWANAAPQYSQGIELDASTVGYQNISFSFDWYSTTQAIRDLQFQYNTNVNNAAGWTNFGGTSPTGTYIAVSNDFYNAPGNPTLTVNLSSISGANNDALFGVRLVSAYDSTGGLGAQYASAQLTSGGQTQQYNNSSGNWRFDNLTFSGTAVPLPATAWLLLSGLAGLGVAARRRR